MHIKQQIPNTKYHIIKGHVNIRKRTLSVKSSHLATSGHIYSSCQGMRILVLALLPSTLLCLPVTFRPIQIKNPIRPQVTLTSRNILEVVKLGLSKNDVKQILQQLFKRKLQKQYMKNSRKGLTIKLKQNDLVKIFSKKATLLYILFMGRIQ